jgi:hypothetical protein
MQMLALYVGRPAVPCPVDAVQIGVLNTGHRSNFHADVAHRNLRISIRRARIYPR